MKLLGALASKVKRAASFPWNQNWKVVHGDAPAAVVRMLQLTEWERLLLLAGAHKFYVHDRSWELVVTEVNGKWTALCVRRQK